MEDKIVFISGAGGMIGKALTEYLMSKGIQVIANTKTPQEIGTINHSQDITEPLTYKGRIDYIVHLGALATPEAFKNNPVEVMTSNFIGIKNLLDYAKENKVERVLYVSSGEVYGKTEEELTEEASGYVDILKPRSCYPISKRASETLCISYMKEYGVDVVIARPCHIFGKPGEKDNRVFAQFIRNIENNEDIVLKSEGKDIRSYCYINDCVKALFKILLEGKKGEAYNISSEAISIKELAEIVAKIGNKKVVYETPKEEEQKVFNPMSKAVLNSNKLRALGWKPEYTIEEGFKKIIKGE